jgi:hypothetical protein
VKYFVYYNDGCYENGDVGFNEFDNIDTALNFISERISADSSREISDYALIEGKERKLKAVQLITKIETA